LSVIQRVLNEQYFTESYQPILHDCIFDRFCGTEIEFRGERFCCTWKSRAIKNSAIFPFAFYLGEKLLPSDKYVMTEQPLNEYSWQMNLTVNSLEKRDFGGYVCSSVNALGKYDGVVRLQGTKNSLILSKIVFCLLLLSSSLIAHSRL